MHEEMNESYRRNQSWAHLPCTEPRGGAPQPGTGRDSERLAGPRALRFCGPHVRTGPTAAGTASSVLCLPVAAMWWHKEPASVLMSRASQESALQAAADGRSVGASWSLSPSHVHHCPAVSPSPLLPRPSCVVCS